MKYLRSFTLTESLLAEILHQLLIADSGTSQEYVKRQLLRAGLTEQEVENITRL